MIQRGQWDLELALMACHAIQCGCVLAKSAKVYLESIKGKWINWKRREDGTPEVLESWSRTFLDLILHKDCKDFLTDIEKSDAPRYRKIASLLSFNHNVEVTVKMIEPTSVDTKYPDHMVRCRTCTHKRPLSLIETDGGCGYYHSVESDAVDRLGKTFQYYFDLSSADRSVPTSITYVQVRCYCCGSIYSRNSEVNVPGYSKCHNCRGFGTPSPACECSDCNLNFVNWYGKEKFVGGKCGGCTAGLRHREIKHKEFPTLVQQLFGDHFKTMCKHLGFTVENSFKSNCALYDAVLHISQDVVEDSEGNSSSHLATTPAVIPTTVLFNFIK